MKFFRKIKNRSKVSVALGVLIFSKSQNWYGPFFQVSGGLLALYNAKQSSKTFISNPLAQKKLRLVSAETCPDA